jgi:phage shock protein PspC (stress-responsive transcriptional regulator)
MFGLDPHTVRWIVALAAFVATWRVVLRLQPWRWVFALARRG